MDNLKNNTQILAVAVPLPLRKTFDFILSEKVAKECAKPCVGARVLVPFANRKLVGVIYQIKDHSDYPENKLKSVIEIIDNEVLFSKKIWRTLTWMADYYLAPLGEVLEVATPTLLRQNRAMQPLSQKAWQLTEQGRASSIDELTRAPVQLSIVKKLEAKTHLVSSDFADSSSGWRQAVTSLIKKGWLQEIEIAPNLPNKKKERTKTQKTITLNEQQNTAIESLQKQTKFAVTLLHGVTGSGKTEVYFAAINEVLNKDKQVLLLVPEIGLTPQLMERVAGAFDTQIVAFHSGLNDTEKHLAWWHAKTGDAKIVIGTRSAVFTPLANLGLVVVDEEHDGSFKQQEGVLYHARDVAVFRAKQENVPIVLASASPSLESYANVQAKRYKYLQLTERATAASLPSVELFDTSRVKLNDGLSPQMVSAMRQTLDQNKQVMLFLNRRGYAPVLYCRDCGKSAECHRCDAPLTIHKRNNQMRCHHCGYLGRKITECSHCESQRLTEVGEGTQRVEAILQELFPDAEVLRIDRDSTRKKGQLEAVLQQAAQGEADILLGTQLLTKGHDFPNVAMVGVLNADQGLYSHDFRSTEYLFQQLLQVGGRAGRRDQIGKVFIQTAFADHPFFEKVIQHDYTGFAKAQLSERQRANYPPFGYFALLRAESSQQSAALQFLRWAKNTMQPLEGVRAFDAIPAPMEKRAGKFRAQLLITATKRSSLHVTMVTWLDWANEQSQSRKVKWKLDIDPVDLY